MFDESDRKLKLAPKFSFFILSLLESNQKTITFTK